MAWVPYTYPLQNLDWFFSLRPSPEHFYHQSPVLLSNPHLLCPGEGWLQTQRFDLWKEEAEFSCFNHGLDFPTQSVFQLVFRLLFCASKRATHPLKDPYLIPTHSLQNAQSVAVGTGAW